MKIRNIKFLAKANIKGNKKSNTILFLTILLVVSLTLIMSFSVTITNAVNIRKEDFRARSLELEPWPDLLNDEVLEEVKQIEHVEDVYILPGMRNAYFNILDISDENGTYEEVQQKIDDEGACVLTWSLIGDEKRSVIAGESLDETPAFSCIIPSLFYPFRDNYDETKEKNNLDYLDSESLIGKTITVKVSSSSDLGYGFFYNYIHEDGNYGNDIAYAPALEYKLNIVGVYYSSPSEFGYYNEILVSEETGTLIQDMALEASGYAEISPEESDVTKWWKTPELRIHYILVDDYENIDYVYNQVSSMGIDCSSNGIMGIKNSVITISNILSIAGTFFVIITVLLCVINLIQSTTGTLRERKGEIGLMKAIGYKNRQIFSCLFYEQLELTLKGFLIGGGISAIFIAISNFINTHTTYANRLYIVNWTDYLIFLAISLCITIIVPLLCQIIALHKLTKIQPKDAMG